MPSVSEKKQEQCAGILFKSASERYLLVRGYGSDMWETPGGHVESGESYENAAMRECVEELGGCPVGERNQAYVVDNEKVMYVVYEQSVKEEFSPNLNSENTGFVWCLAEDIPEPTHDNLRNHILGKSKIAVIRDDNLKTDGQYLTPTTVVDKKGNILRYEKNDLVENMNEYDIALAISNGELQSPQKIGKLFLVDLRITGTGFAYRAKDDEYVHRDPSDFISEEFISRCNGLPVVMGHPNKEGSNFLDSEEFKKRIVGTSFVPYAKNDEVWSVCKIFDATVINMMYDRDLSTSPGIKPDADTSFKKLIDGKIVLFEGSPEFVDHIAIVFEGVWDKNKGPTGINLGENKMKLEEEMKTDSVTEPNAKEEKVDSTIDTEIAKEEIKEEIPSWAKEFMNECRMHISEMKKEKTDGSAMSSTVETIPATGVIDSKEIEIEKEDEVMIREDLEKLKADNSEMKEYLDSLRRPQTADELLELSKYRSKYDGIFQKLGEEVVKPHEGQKPMSFRKMAVHKLKQFSDKFKNVDISKYDDVSFDLAEGAIFTDAQEYTSKTIGTGSKKLRKITERSDSGHTTITFVGDYRSPDAFGLFLHENPQGLALRQP